MIEDRTTSKLDAVAETLGDCARSIEQLGPVCWSFVPSNGAGLRIEARIDGAWLLLRARLDDPRWSVSAADAWLLLQQNGGLPGGVKRARLQGQSGVSACAEVPLDSQVDLGLRIPQACAGFEAAAVCDCALWANRNPTAASWEPGSEEEDTPRTTSTLAELRRLCSEAGWRCTEQGSSRVAVRLNVPRGFHRATVHREAGKRVVVTTALAPCDGSEPESCRQAVGLYLLEVSGVVRMARAAAGVFQAREYARFEVAFDSAPCAPELAHALSSLSTACGQCGREAELLRSDESIAREYLNGWERLSVITVRDQRGNAEASLQRQDCG